MSIRHQQRGMALVAALFLIVVLAALGVFAMRIGTAQQQTADLNLLNARALAAANSGIEFGANRTLQALSCPSSSTLSWLQGALAGFSVRVTCNRTTHADASNTYYVYQLDAYAQRGTFGAPEFVFRHASKVVTDWP